MAGELCLLLVAFCTCRTIIVVAVHTQCVRLLLLAIIMGGGVAEVLLRGQEVHLGMARHEEVGCRSRLDEGLAGLQSAYRAPEYCP